MDSRTYSMATIGSYTFRKTFHPSVLRRTSTRRTIRWSRSARFWRSRMV